VMHAGLNGCTPADRIVALNTQGDDCYDAARTAD
jgi:hypothetical protein